MNVQKIVVETGPCRSQTPTQAPSVNSVNVTKHRRDGPGWGYVFSITRRDGLGYTGSHRDSKPRLRFGNRGLGEVSGLGIGGRPPGPVFEGSLRARCLREAFGLGV